MERMYWIYPDVFEAEVEVTAVEPRKVKTAPILFHPDEGGQPADKGTVGDAVVCDSQVVQGEVILTLDRQIPDGRHVARVDREHRLHTATQHTAQHILSGVAARQFGLETVGVHIGLEGCTVDFHEKIGWDIAADLERWALDIVMQDIPVETVLNAQDAPTRSRRGEGVPPLLCLPNAEGPPTGTDAGETPARSGVAGRMPARRKGGTPSPPDVIRIVRIGEYDASACCGAHVRTTGRIGAIRIFDIENRKSGTRMSFLAGRKALERCQSETAILRDLRALACCATADLPSILRKAMDRSKELTKELTRVWSLRLSDLARSADLATIESSPVGLYVGELPRELVTTLAGMIAEATSGAGIVVSDTHIAISSTSLDASDLLKKIRNHAGGKGGGSPKAANGRLDRPLTAQDLIGILANPPQTGGTD